MHIEGIILSKTIYKERDLICNLLLRSGKTTSVYFYGGRGGGKNNKGSILEVGFMIAVELGRRKKTLESNLNTAKEYKLLWRADLIRENFKAFYLASFFLEYVAKIAVEDHSEDPDHSEHEGLFNVLSNALFYLNDALEKNSFETYTHLFIFLTKLSTQLGIIPNTEHCLFCEKTFSENELCLFDPQSGGFSCHECNSKRDEFLSDNKLLREEYQSAQLLRANIRRVCTLPYKAYQEVESITQGLTVAEFNFINYQFGFSADQIRSWQMVSC